MRIGLLDSIPDHSHQRGVTRCFDELAVGLMNNPALRCSWISTRPPPRELRPKNDYSAFLRLMKRFRMPAGRLGAKVADLGRFDVVLDAYYSPLVKRACRALIVYDMIHELMPLSFPPERPGVKRFVSLKKQCCDNSHSLVCISESTRKDLVSLYPQMVERAHAVHLGVSECEPSTPEDLPKRPYFLFVGSRGGYKNFLRAIIAFAKSGAQDSHDLLVVTPSGGGSEEEQTIASEFGVAQAVHYRSSPVDSEVAWFYENAAAIIYPSLYEGFGFPVVEGMRYRTPVICHNKSSVSEIAAGHARECDCESTEEISKAIRWVLLLEADSRSQWIERAYKHSLRFTWEASAIRLASCLGLPAAVSHQNNDVH